jgi:hypothetical protein
MNNLQCACLIVSMQCDQEGLPSGLGAIGGVPLILAAWLSFDTVINFGMQTLVLARP